MKPCRKRQVWILLFYVYLCIVPLTNANVVGFASDLQSGNTPEAISRPPGEVQGVTDLIDSDLASEIVRDEVRERWGEAAVGPPILCSDDHEKLVAYMFPVKLGDKVFPADEVLFFRNSNHSMKELGFDWGADDFRTIVVSARERDFPIPCEFNTLPPYFVTVFEALKVAERELQSPSVKLTRFYFLGRRGEYFEFRAEDRVILVHAYRLYPGQKERILSRHGETLQGIARTLELQGMAEARRSEAAVYRQQVRDEWSRLKERARANRTSGNRRRRTR